MRTYLVLVAAVLAAVACGHSKEPNTTQPPPDTTSTSPSGLNIAADSGFSDRTAVVATALPAQVHVTNAGQPAAGVVVTWTIVNGGGKVSAATSTTTASGAASTTWTVGDTARLNTLSASITGASTTMIIQGVADAPTKLSKASADTSVVVAGSSLVLAVQLVDKFGNVVPEVPVTWAAAAGKLSVSASKTGPRGRSEAVFSTDAAARSYDVTASVTGLGSVSFRVIGM